MRAGSFSGVARIYDPLTGALDAQGGMVRQPVPGNSIPANRITPGMRLVMNNQMPLPSRTTANNANNLLTTTGQERDRDMLVIRVDHSLGRNDIIHGRILDQRVKELVPN